MMWTQKSTSSAKFILQGNAFTKAQRLSPPNPGSLASHTLRVVHVNDTTDNIYSIINKIIGDLTKVTGPKVVMVEYEC